MEGKGRCYMLARTLIPNLLMAVGILVVAGCADYDSGELPDASQHLDGTADNDGDTAVADGDTECVYGSAFVEQFSKQCNDDGDCALAFIAKDCCGTTLGVGINSQEAERLSSAWQVCLKQLAQCGCPAGPPEAEDGNSAQNLQAILVHCDQGHCSSYIP